MGKEHKRLLKKTASPYARREVLAGIIFCSKRFKTQGNINMIVGSDRLGEGSPEKDCCRKQ